MCKVIAKVEFGGVDGGHSRSCVKTFLSVTYLRLCLYSETLTHQVAWKGIVLFFRTTEYILPVATSEINSVQRLIFDIYWLLLPRKDCLKSFRLS